MAMARASASLLFRSSFLFALFAWWGCGITEVVPDHGCNGIPRRTVVGMANLSHDSRGPEGLRVPLGLNGLNSESLLAGPWQCLSRTRALVRGKNEDVGITAGDVGDSIVAGAMSISTSRSPPRCTRALCRCNPREDRKTGSS